MYGERGEQSAADVAYRAQRDAEFDRRDHYCRRTQDRAGAEEQAAPGQLVAAALVQDREDMEQSEQDTGAEYGTPHPPLPVGAR